MILFSVVDENGKMLPPCEKELLMERLERTIYGELRIGDVYTRYSSGQYLVLVIDTIESTADAIAERIRDKYLEGIENNSLLVHYCYALHAAKLPDDPERSRS